jgi:hypothetical protein
MKTASVCRDCGEVSSDLYWFSDKGQKLEKPRCRGCHELGVVRIKEPDRPVGEAPSEPLILVAAWNRHPQRKRRQNQRVLPANSIR